MVSEKDQDKQKVKMILRSPNATSEEISLALRNYFKKYLLPDKPIEVVYPITSDVLSLFDGNLL
jgi:hypothetical protein